MAAYLFFGRTCGRLLERGLILGNAVLVNANDQMSCPEPPKNKKQKLDCQADEQMTEKEKPSSVLQSLFNYKFNQDCQADEQMTEKEKPSTVLRSFFNYEFNEAGEMVDIDSGAGFNFNVYGNHRDNQGNYDSLGEVITDYVYELLESPNVGLKKMEIPLKAKKKNAKGFIFVSDDFDKKEKLLVLVHGSGVVRAGQWARRLIINDCLDHGTQIPYIKRALQEGYGVMVLNTNQHKAEVTVNGKTTMKEIKESETSERHFSYVWKNIIEKAKCRHIFVVAHSYGGYLVVNYFMQERKILDRVVAVAFTDSVHSLNRQASGKVHRWFEENSVNWVTSNKDRDTPMFHHFSSEPITRVSAGTTKHEETSWKAMGSVFRYFDNKYMDRPEQTKGDKSDKKFKKKKCKVV